MLYTSQELFLYDCNRAVKITACGGGLISPLCSVLSPPPAAPASYERLEDGAKSRWHCLWVQGVSWCSFGWPPQQSHGLRFLRASLCPRFTSLVPTMVSFAPWPVEGLLHPTVLPFCILPFLPSIFALATLRGQRMGHSPSSSQLMVQGFNK